MNLLRTLTLSSVLQLPKLLKGSSLPHNLVHTDIRLYLSAHTPSDSFYMQRRLPLWWSMTLSWPLTSQTVSSSSKAHLHLRLMPTGMVTVVVTSTTLPTSSTPPPSPHLPLHHPPHILHSTTLPTSSTPPPSPHPPSQPNSPTTWYEQVSESSGNHVPKRQFQLPTKNQQEKLSQGLVIFPH